MNKAIIVASALLLSSCQKSPYTSSDYVSTYIDPNTRCEYILYGNDGIIYRLDSSGKPMCGRVNETVTR